MLPEREQRVYSQDSHSSTSTSEKFLQDIIIENIPIEEEEAIHPTRRSMRIYRSIQTNSVLSEPFLVATNELYFSKLTGRTEANFLADNVIFPKNIWGTPRTCQLDMHISGGTKALSFLFVAAKYFFPDICTDKSAT